MEKKIELEVGPDGTIRTIYDDSLNKFAEDIGGEISTVCRLSNVEWEEINGLKGWVIRAQHDPELIVRDVGSSEPVFIVSKNPEHRIAHFVTRERALQVEKWLYQELLPPRKEVP